MSQQVFADRLGKSKSWVDKVERGVRRLDKFSVVYEIADVLQVDVQLLLGKDAERRPGNVNCIDQVEVEEIRAALERYDQISPIFQVPPEPPPLDELRKAIGHAWLTFQHAKYGVLARALPRLLRDAQAADNGYQRSSHGQDAAHLLGQVYQISSSTLRKLGEHELAWLAADRSIAVSQRSGDHLLAAVASYRVGSALLALGRARPALEVNINIANRLAPGAGGEASTSTRAAPPRCCPSGARTTSSTARAASPRWVTSAERARCCWRATAWHPRRSVAGRSPTKCSPTCCAGRGAHRARRSPSWRKTWASGYELGVKARVLYIVACGSPAARNVYILVGLAQADGWEVCVVATPDGRRYLDDSALATQTGHQVRSSFKNPGDPDVLPVPDAMIVAPATLNTINQWSVGI